MEILCAACKVLRQPRIFVKIDTPDVIMIQPVTEAVFGIRRKSIRLKF